MKKFLILYQSPVSAKEQMSKASPDQAKVGMDAWMAWSNKAKKAIADFGAPLADVGGKRSNVTGFSILQANSAGEIEQLLKDHPHKLQPGATIEIHEFLEMPGMSGRPQDRGLESARRS